MNEEKKQKKLTPVEANSIPGVVKCRYCGKHFHTPTVPAAYTGGKDIVCCDHIVFRIYSHAQPTV